MTSYPSELPTAPSRSTESQGPPPVRAWKRPLDLILLALSLPITGPVMLLLTLWIRVLSSGPIFFVQERVGHGGRRFKLLKFRTMFHGCAASPHEEHLDRLVRQGGPMVKLDALDSRLIPGAGVIRALGLDELPQLINVLRGEMSWVGPRPCTPFELERYESQQLERFSGLPGLTGLWQVSGKNRTSFQEMVELDIHYLRSPSPWRDIRIMLATPFVLVGQVFHLLEARRQRSDATATASSGAPYTMATMTDAGLPVGANSVHSDLSV